MKLIIYKYLDKPVSFYRQLIFLIALYLISTAVHSQEIGSPQGLPKGYILIEGDIAVPKDFYVKSCWSKDSYWPKVGTVYQIPYTFDSGLSQAQRIACLTAMGYWEAVANVDFVGKGTQTDYINFFAGDGNWSMVGRQGNQQNISIVSWGNAYVIAHEICHSLGFWHTQSRPDRDNYVTINWNCIDSKPDDMSHNFDKHNDAGYYGPYDFTSVMHYGGGSFYDAGDNISCDGSNLTIKVKAAYATYQDSIGQRDHLSFWDARMMSFIYYYNNWRFVDLNNNNVENGSFEKPYNTFNEGVSNTPSGGTLWLRPGSYNLDGDITGGKEMTIETTWTDVEIY